MPRTRISIAIYLVLVFASGMMVGLVSYRLYATKTASANNSPGMSEFRKRYLDGMRTKVGASETQIVQITRELDATKQRFDALAAEEQPLHDKIQQEHIDNIKGLLNDRQKIAYDNWRAERERAKQQAKQNK
jgi:hypothetical protein